MLRWIMVALLLAALACGPATQPQPEDPTERPPTPTTSLPESAPTTANPTAAATATLIPPKLTKTPAPTLPPKPTETPTPTLATPQPATTTPAIFPPHPHGLSGCREYNMFGSPPGDAAYVPWCTDELSNRIISVCAGLSDSEAEHTCGKRELAKVSDYFMREGPIQCDAITDPDHQQNCFAQSYERWQKHFAGLFEIWPKAQLAVTQDPAVVAAMKDVISCLERMGHENINTELLFPWQNLESPEDNAQRESGYTADEKTARIELRQPSNQCAKQSGLYAAQDAAWLTELERLAKADPEQARPLLDAGLLEILKRPGIAAFLSGD